jgi:hypothetical protein
MYYIMLHLHPMYYIMLILAHVCAYVIDHVESKSKIKKEQLQGVLEGPPASSCEYANIVVIKVSPGASNHRPWTFLP